MPCPRMPVLLAFGLAIGALQGLLPVFNLASMPHGSKSLFGYFSFLASNALPRLSNLPTGIRYGNC